MTVIPDGIEPVEAYRCWLFEDAQLWSLFGGGARESWLPGEAKAAKCNSPDIYRWQIVRRGMSRETAVLVAERQNARYSVSFSASGAQTDFPWCPRPPAVEPPAGYGFELVAEKHDAPGEGCRCGIYAATSPDGVPGIGNVYGKVKLWGKVVPGEKGYRAEFAYPSEFRVAAELADNEALLAFGVPVIADDKIPAAAPTSVPDNGSLRRTMVAAAAASVTLALLNLAMIVAHLFGWLL